MRTLIEVDTSDPTDIKDAIAHLQSLPNSAITKNDAAKLDLPEVIERLLNMARYGYNRLGYAARVAVCVEEDSSGAAPKGFVMEHFVNQPGENPGQSLGATHRSLERSWEALGGLAFSAQFISTTAADSHQMTPEVAEAVLSYLGDNYVHDAIVQKLAFDSDT